MTELPFPFMTRAVFDTIILAVIIIGLALATVRLYRDFTRPLPSQPPLRPPDTDDNRDTDESDSPTRH